MKKKAALLVFFLIAISAVVFWLLTEPKRLDNKLFSALNEGDIVNGEQMFWAGGCASCHAKKGAKGDEKLNLGGGHRLDTPAGIFITPNISPDEDNGIGNWSFADFANAMQRGVSPDSTHYYPSFPYTSYARMGLQDIADLWAFMKTLPLVADQNQNHELALPFKLRRGTGLWKAMFLSPDPVIKIDVTNIEIARGRYLVEGPGHCGECHTPRGLLGFGGPDQSRWLSGGPAPEGKGKIPNITSGGSEVGSWSAGEIADYLESGFTPSFDSVGGSMVSVQENMAKLSKEDRAAIAAYLKAVPLID